MSIITATLGGQSGTSTVTVTPAALVSIAVTPAISTLLVGGTVALHAIGTYSDGTMVDLTASVIWSSSATTIASVSNAAGTAGTVTGLAVGNATITATSGMVAGTGDGHGVAGDADDDHREPGDVVDRRSARRWR